MNEREQIEVFENAIDLTAVKAHGKYTLNEQAVEKLRKVYRWCVGQIDELGGSVVEIDTNPSSEQASVLIEIPVVEVKGSAMREFSDVLGVISSMKCDQSSEDSILLRLGVSGLWEEVSHE